MLCQQLNLPRSLFFHATFGAVSPCTIAMSAARMMHASRAVGVLYKAHSTPHMGAYCTWPVGRHLTGGQVGVSHGGPGGYSGLRKHPEGVPEPPRATSASALVVSAAALDCLVFFKSGAQWAARGGPAAAGRGRAAQAFQCWGPKGGPCLGPAPPWGECRSAFSLCQLLFPSKSSCAT